MDVAALRRPDGAVGSGGEQRMREPDASTGDGDELACDGRPERRRAVDLRDGADQLEGGISERSGDEQRSSGLLRHGPHPGDDELVQRIRHVHSRPDDVTRLQRTRQLQREERVALGCLVHGPQRRAGQHDVEPLLQQPVQAPRG